MQYEYEYEYAQCVHEDGPPAVHHVAISSLEEVQARRELVHEATRVQYTEGYACACAYETRVRSDIQSGLLDPAAGDILAFRVLRLLLLAEEQAEPVGRQVRHAAVHHCRVFLFLLPFMCWRVDSNALSRLRMLVLSASCTGMLASMLTRSGKLNPDTGTIRRVLHVKPCCYVRRSTYKYNSILTI